MVQYIHARLEEQARSIEADAQGAPWLHLQARLLRAQADLILSVQLVRLPERLLLTSALALLALGWWLIALRGQTRRGGPGR